MTLNETGKKERFKTHKLAGIEMSRLRLVSILAALLLIAAPVMAQTNLHDAGETYVGLLDLIRMSANQWTVRLQSAARWLFWILATIQLVWTFIQLGLKQASFEEMVAELVRFGLVISFFASLLLYSAQWGEAVVNSFRQAGAQAAGVGFQLHPGDMFGLAIKLAQTVGDVEMWNPLTALQVGLAQIVLLLCFVFIAAFMGVTLIESYVAINAAVLFVAFGGSQWTREYAIAMLRYPLSVGAKLFVLTLIVGLIMEASKQWQMAYRHDEASTLTLVGMALVSAYFAKTVPEQVQALISGVSPGGGSILGGMAAMAAAGAAGAAAAAPTILKSLGVPGGSNAVKSVSDLIGSSLSGGGSSGGGSTSSSSLRSGIGPNSGRPSGVPPRAGGGGSNPSSGGATSGSSSGTSNSAPKTMSGLAKTMASGGLRTAGMAAAVAVPGAEDIAGIATSPPPPPPGIDVSETPENIIRADDFDPEDAPPPEEKRFYGYRDQTTPKGKPGNEFD